MPANCTPLQQYPTVLLMFSCLLSVCFIEIAAFLQSWSECSDLWGSKPSCSALPLLPPSMSYMQMECSNCMNYRKRDSYPVLMCESHVYRLAVFWNGAGGTTVQSSCLGISQKC